MRCEKVDAIREETAQQTSALGAGVSARLTHRHNRGAAAEASKAACTSYIHNCACAYTLL